MNRRRSFKYLLTRNLLISLVIFCWAALTSSVGYLTVSTMHVMNNWQFFTK